MLPFLEKDCTSPYHCHQTCPGDLVLIKNSMNRSSMYQFQEEVVTANVWFLFHDTNIVPNKGRSTSLGAGIKTTWNTAKLTCSEHRGILRGKKPPKLCCYKSLESLVSTAQPGLFRPIHLLCHHLYQTLLFAFPTTILPSFLLREPQFCPGIHLILHVLGEEILIPSHREGIIIKTIHDCFLLFAGDWFRCGRVWEVCMRASYTGFPC